MLVVRAAKFAEVMHREQIRKYSKEPYITHPYRVAGHLMSHCDFVTEEMIAAAYLHDVIEDCYHINFRDEPELSREYLNYAIEDINEFGPIVLQYVVGLTHEECFNAELATKNRKVRKQANLDRLVAMPKEVQAIKLCDIYDNVLSSPSGDDFIKRVWLPESLALADAIGPALPSVKQLIDNFR